jgi:hypothetical protein
MGLLTKEQAKTEFIRGWNALPLAERQTENDA